MKWLSQVFTVTGLNLRTLPQRRGASLAAILGVAGVVTVLVAVLSIAEGFNRTMKSNASPATAIVMRAGSDSEMTSGIARDDTRLIAEAPGVLRTVQGPVASAELYVLVDLPKRSTGTDANVPLRGVQPAGFTVRDEIKIISGRRFREGSNEVIAGQAAAAEFAGLEVGGHIKAGSTEWEVVGIFESGGALSESEVWCDAGVLQPAYRRGEFFQAVYARLESPEAFTQFKDALSSDPRLDVKTIRQTDYYAEQSRSLTTIITVLGTIISILMGIGAVFGAIITMYSAVSSRSREIATLRALGFRGGPVVVSVLTESLILALVGGLAGAVLAYLAFNGYRAATLNWSTFSQVAFAFAVTPRLLILAIVYALLMGLLGGIFPAVRAARMPVASALREQ